METQERRAAILRTVVEKYVETAQPVGSQTIASEGGLGVSSATVRNDMTLLEHEGYIVQPHTSAGRIPTDQGYRFFVDHFTSTGVLPPSQRRAVSDFFMSAHKALEDLLHETSQLLTNLTDHAAVVVGPPTDAALVRTVQLVALQSRTVLEVVVLSNGAVDKEIVVVDDDVDEESLTRASHVLSAQLAGAALASIPPVTATGEPHVDTLVQAARDALALRSLSTDPLYVGGASRLAAEQESFSTAESASRLLEMLEHQVVVVSLVRALLDHGLTVRIGAESGVDELRDCSIVLAPFTVEGELAGTVGVLGPTRMDYQQALAAVDAVSQQLGRTLT